MKNLRQLATIRSMYKVLRDISCFSFSQYAEDLLLHHLNAQSQGFYIDVGACHPRNGSTTYGLYLKGWRGITVEPNPDVDHVFKRGRPGDVHLNIGISRQPATMTYHRFEHAEFNTFDDQIACIRPNKIDHILIPCSPLSEVVRNYASDRPIDLLSIDCEGSDFDVLESLDWSVSRPVAILIEDFEQFDAGAKPGVVGAVRAFLHDRGYAVAAQAIFTFLYVDRHAFNTPCRDSGFRLDQSQLTGLAATRA